MSDPVAYAKGDLAFQRVLARAANNVGFELVLNSFTRFPEQLPDVVAELYDRRADSIVLYESVIELVRSGDGAAARSATLIALTAIDDDWLRRHGYSLKPR
jgi:DNA-binding FadR family transcriptional regulator